jgi:DNA-binding beta-propeller fold protein YncE
VIPRHDRRSEGLTWETTLEQSGHEGGASQIDDAGRYLFSAHLAAGLLYVIDLRRNTVVTAISDVPGVEGLAYIGEGHKVYTSNWYENKIGVVDLDGLALGQLTPGPVVISTCHPELAAAGGGSAFRFGRNIRTWEDSK